MGENRGDSGRNRPNGHKKSRVPCSREDEQKTRQPKSEVSSTAGNSKLSDRIEILL